MAAGRWQRPGFGGENSRLPSPLAAAHTEGQPESQAMHSFSAELTRLVEERIALAAAHVFAYLANAEDLYNSGVEGAEYFMVKANA